jgi:hypothetical protein
VGPIPDGENVLHKCDNPSCVNPDHLWLGDQCDNLTDMTKKGRRSCQAGPLNNSSKLTWKQVAEIRMSSETQVSLGRRFGVHQTTISDIKRHKTYGGSRSKMLPVSSVRSSRSRT